MKENLPEISFERSMNHNYMILSKCSFFGKNEDKSGDYRTKMLLENRIPGLLPVTHRLINGESRYYYEINSLQSLDRLYGKTEIRYDALRRLLSGCVGLFDRLEEYLLDGTQIIMKPELIYMDIEKMEPYFVCYPDYEGDVRLAFTELIDDLLTRIDHTDERAVMIGYQIYRYTRNPNYVISEIGSMLGRVIADMTRKESDTVQNNSDTDFSENYMSCTEKKSFASGSLRNNMEDQERFTAYFPENEEEDTAPAERTSGQSVKGMKHLLGGIICIFVSLCSGAVILGAHMIPAFQLGGNMELYLYGAMGMATVAAVLFFSCYLKKRRLDNEMMLSDDRDDCEDAKYYTAAENESAHRKSCDSAPQSFPQNAGRTQGRPGRVSGDSAFPAAHSCSETVFLGDGVVEERVLCGRINGEEVSISLDRLPMTVGKLSAVSDFVINDTSVSKMHARFEERGGRIYVCDLNSTNGTVRNGVMLGVNQSVALEPGDRLRFGRTCFTYC